MLITFPFTTYHITFMSNDVGRLVFAIIAVIIGLLQIQGSIFMTHEPRMRLPDMVFGFLEMLLGIVVLASPVGDLAGTIAFVWVVLVAIYMFFVARRLHNWFVNAATRTQ